MEKIFLFDVDGTLTPARQPMTPAFTRFFADWAAGKNIYLVSGSDYPKLQEQVPAALLKSLDGVFGCMGNTLHSNGHQISKRRFVPSSHLILLLQSRLATSRFPLRVGKHFEERTGMLNFSIVGRNALPEERKAYFEYDEIHKERAVIAEQINWTFDDVEAAVGGEISIDIYPTGADKSQVLSMLPEAHYVFFGDRMRLGGNDYALAEALRQSSAPYTLHPVATFEETWEILQKSYI